MAACGNVALYATNVVILNFSNATAFIVKPVDTLVLAGDSTQLNCTFKVTPAVSHKLWYHRNVLIAEEEVIVDPYKGHYEVVGEGDVYNLRIHNTASVDEGEYKCTDFGNLSRTTEAFLYVIEHDPECTVHPSKTVKHGEDVVLTCTIDLDTNAPGNLVWLKDGEEVSRMGGQSNTWETQLSRSDNNAIFDCQLQHYTLPPWKWSEISCEDKIQADVQYLSEFNMTVSPNTTLKEGERITIDCTARDGNPGPYNTILSRDKKIVISNDGLDIHHTILSISRSESGVYKCEAITEFHDGSENHWYEEEEIVVYSSVTLIETSTTVEALLGDVVDLVCTADGFPTPTVMWFDSEDEVILGSEENKNVTTVIDDVETVTSTLTVSVVSELYYGIYTCEAMNGIPPSVKQQMHIIEPDSHSDTIAISVTCTVIVVVLIVGIALGILFYKKRVTKDQSSNTDYANAGLDTSDYAEIPESNSSHRQETGLSETIDIDPFQEITGEKFHPKSTQHVGRQNITSSRMTQAPRQKDVGYYEVALSSIDVPVQQSQSEPANTEQTQYASLQPTQPNEYQSLRT